MTQWTNERCRSCRHADRYDTQFRVKCTLPESPRHAGILGIDSDACYLWAPIVKKPQLRLIQGNES